MMAQPKEWQFQTEKFGACDKDCNLTNNSITVENRHTWTNHRTCYGSIGIPSNKNCIATWTIQINRCPAGVGWITIGIDSIQQTDTWFYQNKDSPNYGYECTGNMYELGECKSTQQKYTDPDQVTMELNTLSGELTFYKNKSIENPPEHTFKIKTGSQLVYKLAVSVKDAQVSIVGFNIQSKEENEEKKEEEHVHDISNVYDDINSALVKFKEIYNQKTLRKIYDENPMDLLKKDSSLNSNIKLYQDYIANIIESSKSFNQYIENTKSMINNMSSVNESQYKNWDINTIIVWIGTLENGRYVKYVDVLRDGFIKSEVNKGEYLPDLDVATLSVDPFNIKSFPDKRDLVRKFKKLQSNEEIEGTDATVYH